jgi:hypothetical protein
MKRKFKVDPAWRPVTPGTMPVGVGVDQLAAEDPAVQAVVDSTLKKFKYALAAAAVDAPVSSPSEVDLMFREFIAQRRPEARARYAEKANAHFNASPEERRRIFGQFADLKPHDYGRVGFNGLSSLMAATGGGSNRVPGPVLPPPRPKSNLRLDPEAMRQAGDLLEGSKFKKLGLFIKEVHCIDDTSEFDSDEINLGGIYLDADGQGHEVPQFSVFADFDAGESIIYPEPVINNLFEDPFAVKKGFDEAYAKPGMKFAEWTVRTDLGWPTAYAATIVMAEKDDGGFAKFLRKLLRKIVEEVEKELKMGIGAAVGAVIGGAVGGGWGAVVGAVVGFVVGALIDWLSTDNADDIVGHASPVMKFGAATLSYYEWTGLLKKPHPDLFSMDFKKDGGFYRVWAYYQLYA